MIRVGTRVKVLCRGAFNGLEGVVEAIAPLLPAVILVKFEGYSSSFYFNYNELIIVEG